MIDYNYKQIDEHVQWLIKMMDREYPNNYELVINSIGAEIRNSQVGLSFIKKKFKKNILSEKEVTND